MWATEHGLRPKREFLLLNTLKCPRPFPQSSPEGNPRFAYSCPSDPELLAELLEACALPPRQDNYNNDDDDDGEEDGEDEDRDDNEEDNEEESDNEDNDMEMDEDKEGEEGERGRRVIKATGQMIGSATEVEVLLNDDEIFHACAWCESWEKVGGPCFQACPGCKMRFYCHEWVSFSRATDVRRVGILTRRVDSAERGIGRPNIKCRASSFKKANSWPPKASSASTWSLRSGLSCTTRRVRLAAHFHCHVATRPDVTAFCIESAVPRLLGP